MPSQYDIETDLVTTRSAPVDDPSGFPFQAIPLNGFLYRFNRETGHCWRLQADAKNKSLQVWQLVKDADGAA